MSEARTGEIYADHAATTPTAAPVAEYMRQFFEENFGNASSVHRRGEAARAGLDTARAFVGSMIGATPEEIVFTASGSEANNLALKGVMGAAALEARAGSSPRRRLVVSAIEHLSVLDTAQHLADSGFDLTIVSVKPDGLLDMDALAAALGDDVALVSVMLVNNEIGTIQPIAAIAALAHQHGARMHCDAIQAVGKMPVDVAALDVDLLSLAGHKFHGPPGAAALYVRRRTRLVPLVHGGHQERSRRAGTENLPAIVGLGFAASIAGERLAFGEPERLAALGDRLLDGLLARIPGARLNGDKERRLKSVVNLCFTGVDGEAVLHELDQQGITVSTGSACSAAATGPSHVLMALGLRSEDAHASVRFSLGEANTDADVDRIIAVTPGIVERLRALDGGSGEPRLSRASA